MAPPKKKKKKIHIKKEPTPPEVDVSFYEVEAIRKSNKTNTLTVAYTVKWKDYEEYENTEEPEPRITSDKVFIEYARKGLDLNGYTDDIEEKLRRLDTSQEDFLDKLDKLAIIGQTNVFGGSVKFAMWDSIGSKTLFLRHMYENNQTFLLHALKFPELQAIERDMDKYMSQLTCRSELFGDYPVVQIKLPHVEGHTFYAPPPLSKLIFEPVSENMWSDRNEHYFPKMSKKKAFNGVCPFIQDRHIRANEQGSRQHFQMQFDRTLMNGMRRKIERHPRFNANLVLRQEVAKGWTLRVGHLVEKETPLMMMCGVIRSTSVAQSVFKEYGEQVAFSTFIEIPGTGACLDRREYYDFSKYIPHSCEPTCSVRLVESGNRFPDLVVYSKDEMGGDEEITIDYFKSFKEDVDKYFENLDTPDGALFKLYETSVDFVHCLCYKNDCRERLYVDQSEYKMDPKVPKDEKIRHMQASFQFRGMQVAESNTVWKIENGQFIGGN